MMGTQLGTRRGRGESGAPSRLCRLLTHSQTLPSLAQLPPLYAGWSQTCWPRSVVLNVWATMPLRMTQGNQDSRHTPCLTHRAPSRELKSACGRQGHLHNNALPSRRFSSFLPHLWEAGSPDLTHFTSEKTEARRS